MTLCGLWDVGLQTLTGIHIKWAFDTPKHEYTNHAAAAPSWWPCCGAGRRAGFRACWWRWWRRRCGPMRSIRFGLLGLEKNPAGGLSAGFGSEV